MVLWVAEIVCGLDDIDVAMQRSWQAVLRCANDFGAILVAVLVVFSIEKTLDLRDWEDDRNPVLWWAVVEVVCRDTVLLEQDQL